MLPSIFSTSQYDLPYPYELDNFARSPSNNKPDLKKRMIRIDMTVLSGSGHFNEK